MFHVYGFVPWTYKPMESICHESSWYHITINGNMLYRVQCQAKLSLVDGQRWWYGGGAPPLRLPSREEPPCGCRVAIHEVVGVGIRPVLQQHRRFAFTAAGAEVVGVIPLARLHLGLVALIASTRSHLNLPLFLFGHPSLMRCHPWGPTIPHHKPRQA